MKYELKAIPYWPFIKITFFINLICGFLFGFFLALIIVPLLSIMSSMAPLYDQGDFGQADISMGFMMILMPILYSFWFAFAHTIIGLIFVFIYNFIAKFVGGIELDLQQVQAEPQAQTYQQPIQAQTAYQQPAPPQAPPAQVPPAHVIPTTAPAPTYTETTPPIPQPEPPEKIIPKPEDKKTDNPNNE